jgi:orotate phosphoribosyltransferase
VREIIGIIQDAGAQLAGVVIGLDRQERGAAEQSAVQELQQSQGVPVLSIIAMGHIIAYLEAVDQGPLAAMQQYRQRYGV